MYIVGIEDNYYTTNEFTSPAVQHEINSCLKIDV